MAPGHRSHGEPLMKFPRMPHLRSAKFAPFALISLFFLTNFTGLYFSPVFAPDVAASSVEEVETIPADIPVSGDCDLDWIIFLAREREGVDPRFIQPPHKPKLQHKPAPT